MIGFHHLQAQESKNYLKKCRFLSYAKVKKTEKRDKVFKSNLFKGFFKTARRADKRVELFFMNSSRPPEGRIRESFFKDSSRLPEGLIRGSNFLKKFFKTARRAYKNVDTFLGILQDCPKG